MKKDEISYFEKKMCFSQDFGRFVVVQMVLSFNNSPEFIGIDWNRENDENK